MKADSVYRWGLTGLVLAIVFALGGVSVRAWNAISAPAALGTGFTYQGYLTQTGTPITGTCELTFGLWNAPSGGTQVGINDVISGVAVVEGRFTVTLNDADEFGPTAFQGDNRWLEIAVQCPPDASPTVLSTRQPINPVPYALFAERFAGYGNLIIVAKSGGDFNSVAAAVNAIGVDPAYPAATSTNPYLVYVAPGIYDDARVQMKEYVDIEGAGEGVTIIRYNGGPDLGPSGATVSGANNAEIRNLTVENTGGAFLWAVAFYDGAQTRLTDVTLIAATGQRPRALGVGTGGHPILNRVKMFVSSGTSSSLGIDVFNGSLTAEDIYVNATGAVTVHAIFGNTATQITIRRATIYASGGSPETNGVLIANNSGTVLLDGLDVTVYSATGPARGLYILNVESVTVLNSFVKVTADDPTAAGPALGMYFGLVDVIAQNNRIEVIAEHTSIGFLSSSGSGNYSTDVDGLDVRAFANTGSVTGFNLFGAGTNFATVSNLDVYAEGVNNSSLQHYGVYQSIAGGTANYQNIRVRMKAIADNGYIYGFKVINGTVDVNGLTVYVAGETTTTVIGLEWDSNVAGGALHNAVINAEQNGTGDAVGTKINRASDFTLNNVVTSALAFRDAYGFHLLQGRFYATGLRAYTSNEQDSRLVYGLRADNAAYLGLNGFDLFTTSTATDPGTLFGLFANSSSVMIQQGTSIVRANDATSYGLYLTLSTGEIEDARFEAQGEFNGLTTIKVGMWIANSTGLVTVTDVTARTTGTGTNYGASTIVANDGATTQQVLIRNSVLVGETTALRSLYGTQVVVVNSVLEGGATSLINGTLFPTATCTDVTYDTAPLVYASFVGPASCP